MSPWPVPPWIRTVAAAFGIGLLALGVVSLVAPTQLFGVDGYHLLTRFGFGVLGAGALGMAVATLLAATGGHAAVLQAVLWMLFVAVALVPPLVIYNIGAFNQRSPDGWWAFGLAGGVILVLGLPLMLALRVLARLGSPAPDAPARAVSTADGSSPP